jgi:Excreted virulence factor EspC, type VII ESX diderm
MTEMSLTAGTTLRQENCRRATTVVLTRLIGVESSVRLDPVGLEWLAATCTCLAAEMTDTAQASTAGPPCQATSQAVAIVHSNVATTRALLRARMASTAAKLKASASYYVAEDANSAAAISALVKL